MARAMSFLSNMALAAATLGQLVMSNPAPDKAKQCRPVPGDPDWPSPDKWAALNRTVSGHLIAPVPPAAPCHADQPNYDPATCANLKQAFTTFDYYNTIPVGSQVPAWDNDTCLPVETAPCSAKGYPSYVINATTAADVKAGVDFGKIRQNFSPSSLKGFSSPV